MRTEYSAEEKQRALDIYVERGLSAAWRETGIPKPTVASWARRENLQTFASENQQAAIDAHSQQAEVMRARIRVTLLEKVEDLLSRMDAEHIDFKGKDADAVTYPIAPASAVQNYATSVGILIDKYRLEAGEATTRDEHRDITHDDHERDALRDAIRREIAERHTDRETAPDPHDDAVADHPKAGAGTA